MMSETMNIPIEYGGKRLDVALSALFPAYSRSQLQRFLKAGLITVDGNPSRAASEHLEGNEVILFNESAALSSGKPLPWAPEKHPLNIVYEDAKLMVINKPVGWVVHPAAGNWQGTLVNALLAYMPDLTHVPRAGIVHRLDKDTSGLLLIAKTLPAHHTLVEALAAREVHRHYIALVQGNIISGGTINAPVGRHPHHRIKMAVTPSGRNAITHYRVRERFSGYTLLNVQLETGRTHQIRVHCAHIGHPIVGDSVYGGRSKRPPGCTPELLEALGHFKHQALHATQLSFMHPTTNELMTLDAPLPEDWSPLLTLLHEREKSLK